MTDRDLLELAAKAAGWDTNPWTWSERAEAFRYCVGGDWVEWNPLTNDGDALRLAVKLRMCVLVKTFPHAVVLEVYNGETQSSRGTLADVRFDAGNPFAATRRAIVRAAAEIGGAMS